MVVCDEPSSITDAYALIKLLSTQHSVQRVRVVANMTRRAEEGANLFNKLNGVCEKFLDITLQFMGAVPFDENVRKAVQSRKPLLQVAPTCKASTAIRHLAAKVDSWPAPSRARGHLEFFFERLLDVPRVASF